MYIIFLNHSLQTTEIDTNEKNIHSSTIINFI